MCWGETFKCDWLLQIVIYFIDLISQADKWDYHKNQQFQRLTLSNFAIREGGDEWLVNDFCLTLKTGWRVVIYMLNSKLDALGLNPSTIRAKYQRLRFSRDKFKKISISKFSWSCKMNPTSDEGSTKHLSQKWVSR